MQAVRIQMFDRGQRLVTNIADGDAAGAYGATVHMDGATPAQSSAAVEAGTPEAELVAQHPQKQRVWGALDLAKGSINGDLDHLCVPRGQVLQINRVCIALLPLELATA